MARKVKTEKIRFYEEINGKPVKVGIATYNVYTTHNVYDLNGKSNDSLSSDLLKLTEDTDRMIETNIIGVIRILSFRILKKYRNKGYGSKYIKEICDKFEGMNYIVCIKSMPLLEDYPVYPNWETHVSELIKQGFFLEVNRFRDISSMCNFPNGVAYLHISNISKPILKQIISFESAIV